MLALLEESLPLPSLMKGKLSRDAVREQLVTAMGFLDTDADGQESSRGHSFPSAPPGLPRRPRPGASLPPRRAHVSPPAPAAFLLQLARKEVLKAVGLFKNHFVKAVKTIESMGPMLAMFSGMKQQQGGAGGAPGSGAASAKGKPRSKPRSAKPKTEL